MGNVVDMPQGGSREEMAEMHTKELEVYFKTKCLVRKTTKIEKKIQDH
jgi:hypothetical protein